MPLSAKANLLRAMSCAGPDYVPYEGEGAWRWVSHVGVRPPRAGLDEWGVTWAPLPAGYATGVNEPAESYPCGAAATSIGDLLARPLPAGGAPAHFAGLLDGVDRAQALVIGLHGPGLLGRFSALLGAERALATLLAEPEASRALLARIADYHVATARRYLATGVEAGWLADDYAGSSGPLLRPSLWQALILPELARIVAVYRAAGAPVFFHTCGRAEAFVGHLLDAGVTVLNLESRACDLAGLKARYGRRIAFFGGVPAAVMLHGSPADVQQAVRQAICSLGSDGGLILAPDQPLAYGAANEQALVRAAQRYGHCGE